MKRQLILLAATLCCALTANAEKKGPVITFEETDHNFGVFDIYHALQSCYFKFTNTGDEDLVISDVVPSCNCTVPEYPKYPIAPGESDSIKVSYNGMSRRPGVFRKIVTIDFNGKTVDESFARITITGEMVDKEVKEQMDEIKEELDKEYKEPK